MRLYQPSEQVDGESEKKGLSPRTLQIIFLATGVAYSSAWYVMHQKPEAARSQQKTPADSPSSPLPSNEKHLPQPSSLDTLASTETIMEAYDPLVLRNTSPTQKELEDFLRSDPPDLSMLEKDVELVVGDEIFLTVKLPDGTRRKVSMRYEMLSRNEQVLIVANKYVYTLQYDKGGTPYSFIVKRVLKEDNMLTNKVLVKWGMMRLPGSSSLSIEQLREEALTLFLGQEPEDGRFCTRWIDDERELYYLLSDELNPATSSLTVAESPVPEPPPDILPPNPGIIEQPLEEEAPAP